MVKLPEQEAIDRIRADLAAKEEIEYPPPVEGKCNARIKPRNGKPARRCMLPAGSKTDHLGFGPCTHHFGMTPRIRGIVSKHVYEAEFARHVRFGELVETDPMSGILTEISRTNGFISYLERIIGQNVVDGRNEDVQLTYEDSFGGVHIEPAVAVWRSERVHFARCCKMAADMGVAQAALDMAKVMGDRLAMLLEMIIRDLGRDPEDPEVTRIVSGRLALVGGTEEAVS